MCRCRAKSAVSELCAASLALCAAYTFSAPCAFTVADGSRLCADIVIPAKPIGAERFAADELKHHLDKAFGDSAEIISEKDLPRSGRRFHFYIGATKAAAAAGIPGRGLALDEHIVRTAGDGLFLVGRDSAINYDDILGDLWRPTIYATVYAVYDFLENEMGVKWIWPGPTGEVVPRRESLRVGPLNRSFVEPLEDRVMGGTGRKKGAWQVGFTSAAAADRFFAEQTKFLVRHRLGRRHKFISGHSFEDWWDRFGKTHPEYFNMLPGGHRRPAWSAQNVTMCVSEPGVWRQKVEDWKAWWEKTGRPGGYEPWVNCCENDYVALCQCPKCRAWDAPDERFAKSPYWNGTMTFDYIVGLGRKHGRWKLSSLLSDNRWGIKPEDTSLRPVASLSDRYAKFYNNVQAEVAKVNPEARVIGYAYENYLEAPKETRVDPRVVIEFVPRSYFPYDKAESEHFRRNFLGWRRAGVKDFIYRPNYMLAGGNYPFDQGRYIMDDFAFAYKNGMKSCSFDSLRGSWACHAMMTYALIRAFREPLRDYERSRADVISAFGPAKKEITRYFDFIRRHNESFSPADVRRIAWQNPTGSHNGGGSFNTCAAILGDYFDDGFFSDGYALLDAARRAAGRDAEVVSRVEFLRKGLRDAELTRKVRIAQKAMDAAPRDETKKVAFLAAFDRMTAYRASVEGDFICNFLYEASKEMRGLHWPYGL